MSEIIYVCPSCSMESDEPGTCLECGTELIPTCSVCWNPIEKCTCEDVSEEDI